ncbi:PIR Superfamily Protein [Plasmodium ovale wallikeri]|uniref:PIR Superfamily Protein n=2 Tax=Plasmodium ovale TaxID=36330 RepID=A0A1A9ADD1_PLAOA|nr:PIR Superfamily Protein [Plasmodium ovale wallikeri]SBT56174.1 PIR Superfamily Protein [Plasmodium ovale wallikeri]SBT73106.1 PIR protein [Plasmodium ovale]
MGSDDEDEDDGYIYGDTYYSSVRTFLQYEAEFNIITNGSSKTQVKSAKCDEIIKSHISSNDFSDKCHKVSKYLHYIKYKDDTKNRCRCLNYLLNTRVEFNAFPNKNFSELFSAYAAISDNMQICKLYIGRIHEEDLEKIEKLYNLNEAMKKLNKSITDNDARIYRNAEDFAEQYRNAIKDCQTDNNESYCTELKEIEKYIYGCIESEKYKEAWKILKTLIPNDGTSSIVSCIMILGIPFFLYSLYKFTPLGPWTYKQIQKKKKMWNDLSENEHYLNNHSHENLNMENSKFNIKYQSV